MKKKFDEKIEILFINDSPGDALEKEFHMESDNPTAQEVLLKTDGYQTMHLM